MTTRTDIRIALAFACLYLVWGTTYLGIALSIQTLPPFTSGALRFVLASALLYGWLWLRGRRPFAGLSLRQAILSGVLLPGIGNGFVIWAQQGVPSGIAALVVSSIPVCVLLLDWAFFSRRAPAWRAVVGIAIAIVGVGLILSGSHSFASAAGPLYLASLLLAVLAWSTGTLLQKGRTPADNVLGFTCLQMLVGGLFQATMALVTGEWLTFDPAAVSLTSMLGVLYLAVFGSIVALNCFLWLLTRQPAQKVATYALVNPVVAVILGTLILGERLSITTGLASVLVVFGVALVLFREWRLPRLSLRGWRRGGFAPPASGLQPPGG